MTTHLRDDVPALRDVLTDGGRELPPIQLTNRQRAELERIVCWDDDPIRPCTCTHDIDDHQSVEDEWLIGGIAVREIREECTECKCEDFEEEDPNA